MQRLSPSQRLLSVCCAIFVAIRLVALHGMPGRSANTPAVPDGQAPLRRHVMKLEVFVAILVIVTNESLLALDAPLATRVATLSLLPVVLHCFFRATLLLTGPLPSSGRR